MLPGKASSAEPGLAPPRTPLRRVQGSPRPSGVKTSGPRAQPKDLKPRFASGNGGGYGKWGPLPTPFPIIQDGPNERSQNIIYQ